MPEMSREEFLAYIQKELGLPEVAVEKPQSTKDTTEKSKSVIRHEPTRVTIAEFIRDEDMLRRIRLAHGIVAQSPFLEPDYERGLITVQFNKLALWTNAAAKKEPLVRLKPSFFTTEHAFTEAQQRSIALPPHLGSLRNAFLPYSPTQLMVAEGEEAATALLQKFVTPLSLVVPREFQSR